MNLYSKKGLEKFKVFIGFKNQVCCNLCVFTDGLNSCLEVSNTNELYRIVLEMFNSYNPAKHIHLMQTLTDSYRTPVLPVIRKNEALPVIATRLSKGDSKNVAH